MIVDYIVKCPCKFRAEVSYGKDGEERINEVYSCPKCKNLFTLKFKEKLSCPKCQNNKLNSYNPNKKENLDYYKKMLKTGILHKKGMDELMLFWNKINDLKCPKCGKKTLSWDIKAKDKHCKVY